MSSQKNSRSDLLAMASAYQASCLLGAAAELDLFLPLIRADKPLSAVELALILETDERGTRVLLDALVSLGVLLKTQETYRVAAEYNDHLDPNHPDTVIPMLQHMLSCQRRWTQLDWTVKSGLPAPTIGSMRGPVAENRSFILAMNSVGKPIARTLVQKMKEAGLLRFKHVLDLGGASGTYTLALLCEMPEARATIFDLPIAIDEARKRLLRETEHADRITLAGGDFYRDEFPAGVDCVWISAIIHQHDREASRAMYRKARQALANGGQILIRDVFAMPERTSPTAAAMFAVNMLTATKSGMVYTVEEVLEDLQAAGFRDARLAIPAEDMSAVIEAVK